MKGSLRIAALALAGLLVLTGTSSAQSIAITGATIHTLGPLGTIKNGSVLMENGVITAIGEKLNVPAGATVIDGTGKVITPGIFDPYSDLGLVEISAAQQTVDSVQAGDQFGAAFTVDDAINPRSTLIPVSRIAGITRATVLPGPAQADDPAVAQSIFAGQGAIIHLGGGDDYLVASGVATVAFAGEDGASLARGARSRALLRLRAALEDARDYADNRPQFDAGQRRAYSLSRHDLAALAPVLSGDRPLLVHAHRVSDIEAILRLKQDYPISPVIVGASEAWLVADKLARASVPVIITPTHNLPRGFDRLAASLEAPARLHEAGVLQAFAVDGAHNARNLTQEAGNAVAHGLPWIEALKAITLNPARIYRMDNDTGTLAPGKDADAVLWSGDPLEVTTAAEAVFVRGRQVEMTSRQTRLRDRYLNLDQALPPAYR